MKVITILLFLISLTPVYAQISLGNSIIFLHSNEEATPLVIYKNGKYIDPPRCYYDDQKGTIKNTKSLNEFKAEISKFDSLILLNNGLKFKAIKVRKIKECEVYVEHIGTHHSIELESAPEHKLLTNNPKIGTNKLQPLDKNDRPVIMNRKIISQVYIKGKSMEEDITITPISKVDIDGDGMPEIIYLIEEWEFNYYIIYSKIKGSWKKVFDETLSPSL